MTDLVNPAPTTALDGVNLHPLTSAMVTQPGTKPVTIVDGKIADTGQIPKPATDVDVKIADTCQVSKPAPAARAATTPPGQTFTQVKVTVGDGELLYWPEKNTFLALYPDEILTICADADEHTQKIKVLQAANQKVTEASYDLNIARVSGIKADMNKAEEALKSAINAMTAASDDVKKKLEPLSKLDAKDGVKLIELVGRKTKDYDKKGVPIYTSSKTLGRALAEKRFYVISGEKEKRAKEKLLKNGKLNHAEIKHRIAEHVVDKAKFEKKWQLKPDDADAYTGILSEWAKHMNGDITKFLEREKGELETRFNIDPKDPKRIVDLSAEAQLMRYTAGAGLAINFKALQGNMNDSRDGSWVKKLARGVRTAGLGIKANADASFSLAEGKVGTDIFIPHFAGWHAMFDIGEQHFELGYWRLHANIELSAGAGASLAIEADIGITVEGGVQRLRGVPRPIKNRAYGKARAGASGGVNVFAGATAGAALKGALQWLNPEGGPGDGKPIKVKAGKAFAEYKDMATVDGSVAGNAGIGVKGAFKITYESGKFVIYARVGACLGLGCEGSLKFEAGVKTIKEFFKCVAYQLKRADFHKINDAIDKEAYEIYCRIKYIIIATGKSLEDFVDKNRAELMDEFDEVVNEIDRAIKNSTREASEFLENVKKELTKKSKGWLSYAPPEVVGKILWQIQQVSNGNNQALKMEVPNIMRMALGAPQTPNQLETIAERMTPTMGDKQNADIGFAMIQLSLDGSYFSGELQLAQSRLAGVEVRISDPFIWNTDSDFIKAKIGIEHAIYS